CAQRSRAELLLRVVAAHPFVGFVEHWALVGVDQAALDVVLGGAGHSAAVLRGVAWLLAVGRLVALVRRARRARLFFALLGDGIAPGLAPPARHAVLHWAASFVHAAAAGNRCGRTCLAHPVGHKPHRPHPTFLAHGLLLRCDKHWTQISSWPAGA